MSVGLGVDEVGIGGFVRRLCGVGDLLEVPRAVSARWELGAVLKALEARGDHRAVLFKEVVGSKFPVITNVFGASRRIAQAMGLTQDASASETLQEFHRRLDGMGSVRQLEKVPAHSNLFQGESVDLGVLPIGTFAREQTEPYINAGVLLAVDPDTGNVNAGIYRMMKLSESELTVSVDPGHDLGKLIAKHRELGTELPFSLVIGADPVFYLASQAKVSMGRDFYETYSALANRVINTAPGVTNDIPLPDSAEIVLEGVVQPKRHHPEGPYGEFSYYYGSDPSAPICKVGALLHRDNAVYLDIHPVHNDHRNLWLHPGREERLLRKLREVLPSVRDVTIPTSGAGMLAVISMSKQHEGDPKRALMMALMIDMFVKHAVIVDDDIDVRNTDEVLWALCIRFQPGNDLVVVDGLRGYMEDPSGIEPNDRTGRMTSKVGYDATKTFTKKFPRDATEPPKGYEDIDLLHYLSSDEE